MIFPLPKIDFTKPLYLYGAGVMGISYKRQIEQLGLQSMLRAFIEDQPVIENYLGIPVIKVADLTEQQLNDSQFLIASHRLKDVFGENLLRRGCNREHIVFPMDLAWSERSAINSIRRDSSICVYPVIGSAGMLQLIARKAKRKLAVFSARGVNVQITVVVDDEVRFSADEYPEVKVISVGRREKYPGDVLEGNDVVVILSAYDLAGLDIDYHKKVYFHGIGVLEVFGRRAKRHLALNQPEKHRGFISNLKGSGCFKVVFLVLHESVWKMEAVFKRMLLNPLFDPWIMVCPCVSYGDEYMWVEMRKTFEFFERRGYPLVSSYNNVERRWVSLSEINPDIVFFTNPHNLTRREYYQEAYLNYLSCYVPYHHEVGRYGGDEAQYNQGFHNALWKIFAPHECSLKTYTRVSAAKGLNVIVSGYPAMEELIEKKESGIYPDSWKSRDGRCRIIWAPHHTISDAALPYSNFLRYAEAFKDFSELMKDKVVWSFKPHPLLKEKLYRHECWGREKTDAYYEYWALQSHTQLDEGDYTDLFLSSDAMIHDSGSFLAEFLYVEKPVMYLLSEDNQGGYYSDFGLAALAACEIGYSFDDVVRFASGLISSSPRLKEAHRTFLKKEIEPYFGSEIPSEKIINEIIAGIGWGAEGLTLEG